MSNSLYRPLRKVAGLGALVAALGFSGAVLAQNDSIFGGAYEAVTSVVPEQAQVVLYRAAGQGKQAFHVYVDSELQSALMPGGYTVFCVAPGRHSLETYLRDQPLYTGKRKPDTYAEFAGGKTYFLEAPADAAGHTPAAHPRTDAEQALKGLRLQTHVLNRASATQACKTNTKLTLRSDMLFKFGKSQYQDLTAQGHDELRNIVEKLALQPKAMDSIEVIGHADPIGKVAANQRLSQERASTVRNVLLELGIPAEKVHASGRGSSEPVVQCDSGSRQARIDCNAPNRRVELLIHGLNEGL